jgi:magnesium-transporting ATPase (P-type)
VNEKLDKVKKFLWQVIEILFAFLLIVVLVGLILGKDAGGFVQSVMQNVAGFVNAIAPGALVGIAVVLALLYLAKTRWGK